jgi:hypothetical protein
LDIATIKEIKDGPKVSKKNWRIMVDERTGLKFSDFYDTKDGMVEPTCENLSKWMKAGKPVKFLRLDDAGENKKLQKRVQSKDWKLDIEFEYTARNTPQQNHRAELGFAVLANRGRTLIYRANVPATVRYLLFKEAFATVSLLDGFTVIAIDEKEASR